MKTKEYAKQIRNHATGSGFNNMTDSDMILSCRVWMKTFFEKMLEHSAEKGVRDTLLIVIHMILVMKRYDLLDKIFLYYLKDGFIQIDDESIFNPIVDFSHIHIMAPILLYGGVLMHDFDKYIKVWELI